MAQLPKIVLTELNSRNTTLIKPNSNPFKVDPPVEFPPPPPVHGLGESLLSMLQDLGIKHQYQLSPTSRSTLLQVAPHHLAKNIENGFLHPASPYGHSRRLRLAVSMGKLTDVTTRYDSDRAAAKKAKYFAKQQKRSPSVSDVENNSELPWNDIEEKKEMWKKLVEQVWHEEKKKERKEKFAKLTS
jgi:4-alpha-glucanotransferase